MKTLRKLVIFWTLLIVAFGVIGCGNNKSENSNQPSEDIISQNKSSTPDAEGQSAERMLHIVSSTWDPYEYEVNGEAKGIGIEITREAFRRMGYDVDIEFVPFKRALEMIQTGEADILTDVNRTTEREVFGNFSKEPILISTTCLFVKVDSPITFNGDIFEMAPYKFGINRGYTHGSEFDDAVKNKQLIVEEAEDTDQNVVKLINDRIDILIENELVVLSTLKRLNYQSEVKTLQPPYRKKELYLMFSKKANVGFLIDPFDEKVREIKQDGTFQEIYNRYIK